MMLARLSLASLLVVLVQGANKSVDSETSKLMVHVRSCYQVSCRETDTIVPGSLAPRRVPLFVLRFEARGLARG
jgi:hypothetical protein